MEENELSEAEREAALQAELDALDAEIAGTQAPQPKASDTFFGGFGKEIGAIGSGYKSMAKSAGALLTGDISPITDTASSLLDVDNLAGLGVDTARSAGSKLGSMGGLAGGAALGSFVLPPIGTVIGGGLGYLAGGTAGDVATEYLTDTFYDREKDEDLAQSLGSRSGAAMARLLDPLNSAPDAVQIGKKGRIANKIKDAKVRLGDTDLAVRVGGVDTDSRLLFDKMREALPELEDKGFFSGGEFDPKTGSFPGEGVAPTGLMDYSNKADRALGMLGDERTNIIEQIKGVPGLGVLPGELAATQGAGALAKQIEDLRNVVPPRQGDIDFLTQMTKDRGLDPNNDYMRPTSGAQMESTMRDINDNLTRLKLYDETIKAKSVVDPSTAAKNALEIRALQSIKAAYGEALEPVFERSGQGALAKSLLKNNANYTTMYTAKDAFEMGMDGGTAYRAKAANATAGKAEEGVNSIASAKIQAIKAAGTEVIGGSASTRAMQRASASTDGSKALDYYDAERVKNGKLKNERWSNKYLITSTGVNVASHYTPGPTTESVQGSFDGMLASLYEKAAMPAPGEDPQQAALRGQAAVEDSTKMMQDGSPKEKRIFIQSMKDMAIIPQQPGSIAGEVDGIVDIPEFRQLYVDRLKAQDHAVEKTNTIHPYTPSFFTQLAEMSDPNGGRLTPYAAKLRGRPSVEAPSQFLQQTPPESLL
jgi:hypothetical protein